MALTSEQEKRLRFLELKAKAESLSDQKNLEGKDIYDDETLATSTLKPPKIIHDIFEGWRNVSRDYFRKPLENAAGDIAETTNPWISLPLTGTLATAAQVLEPTPENVAAYFLTKGASEVPLIKGQTAPELIHKGSQWIDDVIGMTTVRKKIADFTGKATEALKKRVGTFFQRPEEVGKTVQASFKEGVDPVLKDAENKLIEANQLADEAKSLEMQAKEGEVMDSYRDLLEKLPPGMQKLSATAKRLKAEYYDTIKSLGEKADYAYMKLGKVMGKNKATEPSPALDFIEDLFRKKGVIGYKKVPATPPKSPPSIEVSNYKAELSAEQQEVYQSIFDQAISGVSPKKVASLDVDAPYIVKLEKIWETLSSGKMTRRQLVGLHNEVNQIAWKGNSNVNKLFRVVDGLLADQIEAEAVAGGFGGLAKEATNVYKKKMALMGSDLYKLMQQKEGDLVLKIASARDAETVKILYENVSKKAQDSFKKAFLDYGWEKAGGDLGQPDIGKMYQFLRGRTNEVKQIIFGKDFELVQKFEKLANSLSKSKLLKQNVEVPQVLSNVEKDIASIMNTPTFSETVSKVFGAGQDVSRIEAAYKFMDDAGKEAFKRGLFQDLLSDPEKLMKSDSRVLEYVFGKEAETLKYFGEVLKGTESSLKDNLLYGLAQISTGYSPRITTGAIGLLGRLTAGRTLREARGKFPEIPPEGFFGGKFHFSAEARPGITSDLMKVGGVVGPKIEAVQETTEKMRKGIVEKLNKRKSIFGK